MTNAENENTPIYKRKIADINSENISDLKTVEEGWFVEFKSELFSSYHFDNFSVSFNENKRA